MPYEIYLSQKDTKETSIIKVEEKLDTDVVVEEQYYLGNKGLPPSESKYEYTGYYFYDIK